MARFQAKPPGETDKELIRGINSPSNGKGPYRWALVARSRDGFRLGSIYRQMGDDLMPDETAILTQTCARECFDLRRAR